MTSQILRNIYKKDESKLEYSYPIIHLSGYLLCDSCFFWISQITNPHVNNATGILFIKRHFKNIATNKSKQKYLRKSQTWFLKFYCYQKQEFNKDESGWIWIHLVQSVEPELRTWKNSVGAVHSFPLGAFRFPRWITNLRWKWARNLRFSCCCLVRTT